MDKNVKLDPLEKLQDLMFSMGRTVNKLTDKLEGLSERMGRTQINMEVLNERLGRINELSHRLASSLLVMAGIPRGAAIRPVAHMLHALGVGHRSHSSLPSDPATTAVASPSFPPAASPRPVAPPRIDPVQDDDSDLASRLERYQGLHRRSRSLLPLVPTQTVGPVRPPPPDPMNLKKGATWDDFFRKHQNVASLTDPDESSRERDRLKPLFEDYWQTVLRQTKDALASPQTLKAVTVGPVALSKSLSQSLTKGFGGLLPVVRKQTNRLFDGIRGSFRTASSLAASATPRVLAGTALATEAVAAASPSAFNTLSKSLEILSGVVGMALLPYAVKLTVWIQQLAVWFYGLSDASKDLIVKVGLGIGAVVGFAGAVTVLGTAMMGTVGVVGLLTAGILALAVASEESARKNQEAHDKIMNPGKYLSREEYQKDPLFQKILGQKTSLEKRQKEERDQFQGTDAEKKTMLERQGAEQVFFKQNAKRQLTEGLNPLLEQSRQDVKAVGKFEDERTRSVLGTPGSVEAKVADVPAVGQLATTVAGLLFDRDRGAEGDRLKQRAGKSSGEAQKRTLMMDEFLSGVKFEGSKGDKMDVLKNLVGSFALGNVAQPGYSSIEESYKKTQLQALGTDPLEGFKTWLKAQGDQWFQGQLTAINANTAATKDQIPWGAKG